MHNYARGDVSLRPRLRYPVLGLCLALGGFAAWLLVEGHREVMLWCGLAFFGGGALVQLLTAKLGRLDLDDDGFTITNLGVKRRFRWAEVSRFGVGRLNRRLTVLFDPRDPARASAHAKGLTGYGAGLPDTYGFEPDELAKIMDRRRLKERR